MKKLLAKIILISLLFGNFNFLLFNQVSAASIGDVLITEVGYDTQTQNESEWIELYNPTGSDIDLTNWKITKNNGRFYVFSGAIISSGDFLLITNDATTFTNEFGAVADVDMDDVNGSDCVSDTECLKLVDSGDSLTLTDDSGNTIDNMAWEGINGYDLTADKGYSTCRRNLNDTDTDAEWANNCTPTPGTGTFVTQFPGGVPVASLLWGKADSENYSNGDTITVLNDRSGNDRDGVNNGTPTFDTTNTINFYPTISFDGASDGIDFPRYSMPSEDKNYTIFTVFKTDLSQNGYLVYMGKETTTNHNTRLFVNTDGSFHDDFENGVANENISPAGTVSANKPFIVSFNYNTDNNEKNIFANGKNVANKTAIADHNTSNTATSDRGLGFNADGDSDYYKGNIAEILAYDTELNSTNRQKIDSYLALKYGITLDQGAGAYNYINSAGDILWDSSANSTYTNDVIGIGQNNLSDLDQKVSHSINSGSILTIATTNDFSSLNTDASRTSLADGKFLIIGNDAGTINSQTGELDTSLYQNRITREWKVQNTGTVGNIHLKFDGFDENYVLLKNSDGDFNSATNVGNLNTSGEISLTLNDGEYFTLAIPITNNIPTDITLSNKNIDENNSTGDLIGNLSTTDADYGDTHSYSFTGTGNDNSSFTLSGSQVLAGEIFDYETKNSYTIRIKTDDGNGGTFEKEFIVTVNNLDDEAPVITLNGNSTETILLNGTFTDQYADWTDNVDGSGSLTSASSGSVDTTTIGTYTLEYTYTDQAGNAGNTVTRTVEVVSGDTPIITLNGSGSINQEVGSTYTDQGAEYSDTEDGTGSVVGSGSVDTNTLGTYTITYDYTDTQGNLATQVTRTIEIVDTTAPVITLTDGDLNLLLNTTFTEPGNSCTDNYDTNCTVVIGGDTVDTGTVGNYIITYNATDTNGNIAIQVTRTVNVTAGNAPVINLIGDNPQILDFGYGNYQELGATATDTEDGNVNVNIDSSNVDTQVVGDYNVIYTATDSQGNTVQKTRVVKVVDTIAPVITLNGEEELTYYLGVNYTEQGATCIDNYDTTCDVVITGNVDNSLIGEYNITYTATDSSGEISTVTRTIYIIRKKSGGSSSTRHMDVCNETGGDFSGDYYDGKCGENPDKEEEVKEEKVKKEEVKKVIEEKKEIKIEEKVIKEKKEINKEKEIEGEKKKYILRNEYKSCETIDNLLSETYGLNFNSKLNDISKLSQKNLIIKLEKAGIINGTKENNFEPYRKISRIEFIKMVLRSHCIEYRNEDTSDLEFMDLDNYTWQAKVVKKSVDLGIASGDVDENGNKVFRANDVISSIEATKILMRMALVQKGEEPDTKYNDLKVEWHKKYVKQGEYLGVFNAEGDDYKFNPNDGIDRNKTVKFLYRVINLYR